MDALETLREMHMDAKQMFIKLQQAQPDQRGGIWAELRPKLTLHEDIEDRFIYHPMMDDAGVRRDSALANWEQQHEAMVQEAKGMIDLLGRVEPREASWLSALQQLASAMDQHIRMEEDTIWPRIRHVWGEDKLESAGGPVQAAKTAGAAGAAISGAIGSAADALRGGR